MPLDAPFPLGPFIVDEQGRLSPTEEGVFPAFSLRWRGHVAQVSLARREAASGILLIQLPLGRVGSTAAAVPAISQQRRAQAFATLRGLTGLVPPGWRLALRADHGINMLVEVPLGMPATATELIAVVTATLLRAAPYLDVLEEAGVEAGTVKT